MSERLYRLPADVQTTVATARKLAALLGRDLKSPLVGQTAVPLRVAKRTLDAHKSLSKRFDRVDYMSWGGPSGLKWALRTAKHNENHDELGRFTDSGGASSDQTAKDYAERNAEALEQPGNYLGAWIEDDQVYMDVSHVFDPKDREKAIATAKEKDQISIADLAAIAAGDFDNAFVSTGGTGKSLSFKRAAVFGKESVTAGDVHVDAVLGTEERRRKKPKYKVIEEAVLGKYNENHDEQGRFASEGDSGGGSSGSVAMGVLLAGPRYDDTGNRSSTGKFIRNPIKKVPQGTPDDAVKGLRLHEVKQFGNLGSVNVEDITTTQDMVSPEGVKRYVDDPSANLVGSFAPDNHGFVTNAGRTISVNPLVMERAGVKFVIDGNHRVVAAKIRGDKSIKAFVINGDQLVASRAKSKAASWADESDSEFRERCLRILENWPKRAPTQKALSEAVLGKYNENHDELGRFATADGASGGGGTSEREVSRLDADHRGGGPTSTRDVQTAMNRHLSGRRASPPGRSKGIQATNEQEATRKRDEWAEYGPKSLDEAMTLAKKGQDEIRDFANTYETPGTFFHDPGVKGRERAQEKLDKSGRSPAQLTDLARAAFSVSDKKAADDILAALGARFEVADEGWKTTEAGYHDRKALVRFASGLVGEIQIVTQKMWDAKATKGQVLYTKARSLPAGPARARLVNEMRMLYSAAH